MGHGPLAKLQRRLFGALFTTDDTGVASTSVEVGDYGGRECVKSYKSDGAQTYPRICLSISASATRLSRSRKIVTTARVRPSRS
jgi:hypothetical protein